MKRKTFSLIAIIILCYQSMAMSLLWHSNYLNLILYYIHPPLYGYIELQRLPMFFGDIISLKLIEKNKSSAAKFIASGQMGMAAFLASYEYNDSIPTTEAKKRTLKIAGILVKAGYNLDKCEVDNESTAVALQTWGLLDKTFVEFIASNTKSENIFLCEERETDKKPRQLL